MMNQEVGADRALVAGATEPVSRLGPKGFDHGEGVTAKELLVTIRKAVDDWAPLYLDYSGHAVDRSYLASLANDIAFELGILEAAIATEAGTAETVQLGSVHDGAGR